MLRFPLDDQFVCFDSRTDVVRIANRVGADIWEYSLQGLDGNQITAKLVADYPQAPPEQIRNDVHATLEAESTQQVDMIDHEPVYVPDTSFTATRPIRAVETAHYDFSPSVWKIESEIAGLIPLLDTMFVRLSECNDNNASVNTLCVFSDNGRFPIVHEGKTKDTGLTLADAAVKCMRELNGLLCRQAPYAIVFHASAVSINGNAVLFPGVGGSGKTTLAAYLAANGYPLLNDDTVPLLRGSRCLQPIPMCLSIKQGSWPVLEHYYPDLMSKPVFGPDDRQFRYVHPGMQRIESKPVPCTTVVIPAYQPGANTASLIPVPRSELLEKMIHGGCIMERPIDVHALADVVEWISSVQCYQLGYSELQDARKILVDITK